MVTSNKTEDFFDRFKYWAEELMLRIKEMTDNEYRVFLSEEIEKMMGISADTLDRWKKDGLPYSKIGHRVLFIWDDILWFLEKRKIRNPLKTDETEN